MIARRGFLGAILAAGVAPAFVRAGVLMPVKEIWVPPPIVAPSGQLGHVASKFYEMEIGRVEGFRFIESPTLHDIRKAVKAIKPKHISGESYYAFVHSKRAREWPFA